MTFCAVEVTIFRVLAYHQGQSPEMSWRHGTAVDHRGCELLGNSPWYEETSTECDSRGTRCRAVGIPVLYLATRYAVLDALKYLTTHVEALPIGGKMRVILPPASVDARVGRKQRVAASVEGWLSVAHVACAYGELEILKWALTESKTDGAEQRARKYVGPGRHVRPDLLLRDPRGRLAIHYCALAGDPRLLRTLLNNSIVISEQRRVQLIARDDEGRTAEELLSSRIIEDNREHNRNSRNTRQRRKRQHMGMGGTQVHGQGMNDAMSLLQESLLVIQAAKHDLVVQGDTSMGTIDDVSTPRQARVEQHRHQPGRIEY